MKIRKETYRLLGVWLALFAVGLLATPRAFLHEHGDVHAEHHAEELPESQIEHGDCPICDMDHASALDVIPALHLPVSGALVHLAAKLPIQIISISSPPTFLRGPPTT